MSELSEARERLEHDLEQTPSLSTSVVHKADIRLVLDALDEAGCDEEHRAWCASQSECNCRPAPPASTEEPEEEGLWLSDFDPPRDRPAILPAAISEAHAGGWHSDVTRPTATPAPNVLVTAYPTTPMVEVPRV